MTLPEIIDLHMHTTVSDGTDSPEEIISKVKEAGIELFAVTDHDAIKGSAQIKQILKEQNGPAFITGIEFSCKDDGGKYHILGYGYDETAEPIKIAVEKAHAVRIRKLGERLVFLKDRFGFTFKQEDIDALYANSNPGKPHIAKMMIEYGYATSIRDAMDNYLNKKKFGNAYTLPEDAIEAILASGGIPVLAHPAFGDGDQLIIGEEMDSRLKHLLNYGLKGLEAYYSGFTPKLTREMLAFANTYDLYVTAGSDYHGSNKIVELTDTGLESVSEADEHLIRFLEDVTK